MGDDPTLLNLWKNIMHNWFWMHIFPGKKGLKVYIKFPTISSYLLLVDKKMKDIKAKITDLQNFHIIHKKPRHYRKW